MNTPTVAVVVVVVVPSFTPSTQHDPNTPHDQRTHTHTYTHTHTSAFRNIQALRDAGELDCVVAGEEFSVTVSRVPASLFRAGSYVELCKVGSTKRYHRVMVPPLAEAISSSSSSSSANGGADDQHQPQTLSFTVIFPKSMQVFRRLTEGDWLLRYRFKNQFRKSHTCLLYTSPSPRDRG